MPGKFHHEQLYRGPAALARLAATRLTLCGAGVVWDEHYRVPADVPGDVCDYPLARNLVLLAVALASEVLLRWLLDGVRESWSATLRDFTIRPLEVSA